jgi:putative DNA primase/helicase
MGNDVPIRQAVHKVAEDILDEGLSNNDRATIAWGRQSQNGAVIDRTVKILSTLTGVHVSQDQLDRHDNLLACANGTVDLERGALRPAQKSDYLTKCLAIEYSASAKWDRWCQFLSDVFEDKPEVVDYLQELIGYGITGCTDEQIFCILYGNGGNGKSRFTDVLQAVFRPIMQVSPVETFLARHNDGGGPSPHLVALKGARLVFTSEADEGSRLAEATVKRLTGGDAVPTRELYGKQFTFTPQFLLLISANAIPEIRGRDTGIWRRFRVIDFAQRFDNRQDKDPDIAKRIIAEEAQGVLWWAVEGARRWYGNGKRLREPECVTRFTLNHRRASDPLLGFMPGYLVPDPDGKMAAKVVYQEYCDWAQAEGFKPWGRNSLLHAIRTTDGIKHWESRNVQYFGLSRSPDVNL